MEGRMKYSRRFVRQRFETLSRLLRHVYAIWLWCNHGECRIYVKKRGLTVDLPRAHGTCISEQSRSRGKRVSNSTQVSYTSFKARVGPLVYRWFGCSTSSCHLRGIRLRSSCNDAVPRSTEIPRRQHADGNATRSSHGAVWQQVRIPMAVCPISRNLSSIIIWPLAKKIAYLVPFCNKGQRYRCRLHNPKHRLLN